MTDVEATPLPALLGNRFCSETPGKALTLCSDACESGVSDKFPGAATILVPGDRELVTFPDAALSIACNRRRVLYLARHFNFMGKCCLLGYTARHDSR